MSVIVRTGGKMLVIDPGSQVLLSLTQIHDSTFLTNVADAVIWSLVIALVST